MYTVKQLAKLAGITPRTLHYYDEIGLLKPTRVGDNGYRYYSQPDILRLQQILLYRELDLPLEQIRHIMANKGFDLLTALEAHRSELRRRIQRLERLITTVDRTVAHLKGEIEMSDKQFFGPLSDEQQAEYEQEAMQMYDPEIVKASNRRWKSYTAADKQRIGEEGNAVYAALLAAMPKGAASPEAQVAVERWRKHMDYFWTPSLEQLVELAGGYVNDARFRASFDRIDPRLAEFVLEAVGVYVERAKK